ncbi:hypothetical protein DPMN_021477 [Dreissena polymorpha]|uniref:Uncharacterized protein n=1 Tax=Dreissena polymorpha TaxID=45954 RepID=A0A9D4NKV2_DREPO|nr:hypothetical protein DPMN_021477 [Dreissena polymorpha]
MCLNKNGLAGFKSYGSPDGNKEIWDWVYLKRGSYDGSITIQSHGEGSEQLLT